jgi:hypothetical protein
MREALIEKLGASGRFAVAGDREKADAVFKGSVRRSGKGRRAVSVLLRLVNARGQVVWSGEARGYGTAQSVGRDDVAAKLIDDLLAQIRKLEGRR